MNFFDFFLSHIFVALPILFAILCLYQSFRLLKRARSLEDIPISKIRSAAQGYVELEGKALPILATTPLMGESQQPCVWYRLSIDHWQTTYSSQDQKKSSYWVTVKKFASPDYFLFQDDTGECIINPNGADIITHNVLIWYGYSLKPSPFPKPSIWNFLFGNFGTFRYKEERIEIGQPIYVTGIFNTLSKEDNIFEENDYLKKYLNNKNQSFVNLLNNQGLDQKNSLLISAISEKKVVRQYRIKAFIFFLGFLFFVFITISSTYPIVKKSIEEMSSKDVSSQSNKK